jgi:hypothetical protein
MTSRQLTAFGKKYMKRLGMEDWIAGAVFRVQKLDGLCGHSEWMAEERKCWIAVTPADEDMMQETLIHEILHVRFEGHLPLLGQDDDFYDAGYELGLNCTAKALWEAWKDS